MLRKLRRKIKAQDGKNAGRLAAALALALALAAPASPVRAATGPIFFNNGMANLVTDDIVVPPDFLMHGLSVAAAGTSAEMTGHSITTASFGSYGAYASAATITMTGTSITTAGIGSYGAFAVTGSTITMNGGSITTTGSSSSGAYATSGSTLTMSGGSITTAGNNSNGAYANGSTLTMTGTSITTAGPVGYGAIAINGSTLTMNGTSIATAGPGGYGAIATMGSTLAMNGGSITTAGENSSGAVGLSGSTLTMTGGSITTTGAGSHGAWAFDGSTLTMNGTSITATGAGSYALKSELGGVVNATVSGQDISGADGLIFTDSGAVNLTANSGSRLYGITTPAGVGTAHLTLNGNAVWTMPGNSALTTLAVSGGTVGFAATEAGGPYKTLTVGGDLAGSGGTFRLSANPGANLADLVSVGGTAGGSHQAVATILGGVPANLYQTVKLIDLVNEGAAHTATFSGGGDVSVWRYGVAQGSALTGYSGVGSLADYYLYNTFGPSTPARAAIADSAAGAVVWHGEMNEIKKRLGDLRLGKQSSDDFWMRAYADKFNVKPGGESYSQIVRGVELGKDNPQVFSGGKKFTGFVVGAGEADNTFSSGGNGEVHSVYAGAYGSWLRDDGSYIDLIGKYNWFRHSFDSPILGGGSDSGSYRNKGLGLSAEIGKRIERDSGVFVQPEAELAALWSGNANYTSANGLAIQVPSADSLQLRLGCTVGRQWQDVDGASRQIYGKLSWINEFRGDSRVVVDSVPFDSSLKGHQWVSGVGFVEDGERYQLYLDAEKSWGNTVSKSWGVNAGYRWKF